jgi:DNA-binding FadR family transcriptional regulator
MKRSARRAPAQRPGAPKNRPRRRIHGRIADELGIAIVTGQHPPGTTLPNEVEASVKLRVSRTAYREAVRILAAKGLVESRPKAGTRVSPRSRWSLLDPDVLAWVFGSGSEPSESFIRALFELREIVEPQAAALAAQRRSADQLARMSYALEEMSKHGLSTAEGRAADQVFHEEILKAAGNELLTTLTTSIGAAVRWTTIYKQRRTRLPRDPIPDHRRLYAAIAEADAVRATDAARELIQLAHQDTRRSLEARDVSGRL